MLYIAQNKLFDLEKAKSKSEFSTIESDRIEEFHKKIGNNETPLIRLNALAKHLGVGSIFLKDESHRFGLNAFKAFEPLIIFFTVPK